MLRAIFVGVLVTVVLALVARLIVRWRFGGKGRTLTRLRPHGGVEYATFALAMAAATAIMLATRFEGTAATITWIAGVVFFLAAAAMTYPVFLTHVFWTADGVGAWDPIRKQRFVRWADVKPGGFQAGRFAHTIADGHRSIAYATWRNGVDELKVFAERRIAAGAVPATRT